MHLEREWSQTAARRSMHTRGGGGPHDNAQLLHLIATTLRKAESCEHDVGSVADTLSKATRVGWCPAQPRPAACPAARPAARGS